MFLLRYRLSKQRAIDIPVQRAFFAGAIVADGDEDQRVVELSDLLQVIDQAANLKVRVGQIARIHFHEARIELLLFRRQLVPGLDVRIAIRKDRIGGNHAKFLLALKDLFAISIPALVELALVLIAPVFVYLVRSMSGARRVIEEERLVRRGLLLAVDIEDRLVGDLIAQVAAIGTDVRLILHQVRLVLVGLRAKKSEEVIEAFSGRPVIKWACVGGIFVRRHAIFAHRKSVVAVVAQNLGDGSGRCRYAAIPAGKSGGHDGV